MNLEDALAPGVDTETFFLEHVPALFEARRELFASAYDTPVIVSVHLTDTDEKYTYEFRPDGCEVEADEMIDFPVVTVAGEAARWEDFKRHVLEVAKLAEKRANDTDVPRKVTREFLDEFERYDGEFVLDLSADDLDQPIVVHLILNDYEMPAGAPSLRIGATFEMGEELARGDVRPKDLENRVKIKGDLSLGLEVGGLLLKYFPELEG
ncbi:hypothetical protein FIV42_28845 [Persicimonas caeni]|uniref:SCP2 sterol-binding domain-containing protein n=1 Tax=Persicimonas caeni TaxID=2292766 RepID=A0A4Y6Q2F0_PERCE|nr:hypothetical protein [Persicimonas caeni]QDG54610.1 hypothetical protein FIV42_28845 [Persicimonas caeni]QED35831.1 hypothetical protein FRD00_28840 [Persicimonas caeni]